MKNRILYIFALVSLFTCPVFATEEPTESVVKQLQVELIELKQIDQAVRKELVNLIGAGVDDNATYATLVDKIEEVDCSNIKKVKKMISQYGWEIIESLDQKAIRSLLLIVEHAGEDLKFQKSALKVFLSYYKKGYIRGQDFAILTDKILLAENNTQLYGTQVEIKNGTVAVYPVEDESELDERRKSLDLPPMSEYLEFLKKFYKIK